MDCPLWRKIPSFDFLLCAMNASMKTTPAKLLDVVALLEDKADTLVLNENPREIAPGVAQRFVYHSDPLILQRRASAFRCTRALTMALPTRCAGTMSWTAHRPQLRRSPVSRCW